MSTQTAIQNYIGPAGTPSQNTLDINGQSIASTR
jgi:hypothetical protein